MEEIKAGEGRAEIFGDAVALVEQGTAGPQKGQHESEKPFPEGHFTSTGLRRVSLAF